MVQTGASHLENERILEDPSGNNKHIYKIELLHVSNTITYDRYSPAPVQVYMHSSMPLRSVCDAYARYSLCTSLEIRIIHGIDIIMVAGFSW